VWGVVVCREGGKGAGSDRVQGGEGSTFIVRVRGGRSAGMVVKGCNRLEKKWKVQQKYRPIESKAQWGVTMKRGGRN